MFGSSSLPAIVAVLEIVPLAEEITVTVTVVVAEAPLAKLPKETVRTPLAMFAVPWLEAAET